MADPLSIAASLTAVVGAGFAVSRGLYEVLSMYKDAPMELYTVAAEIHSMSVMFDCIGEVVAAHEGLFKEQLGHMLRDLRCRFRIIQDVIAKCVKPSRVPAAVRLRYLFVGRRVAGLVLKLQGLKHSLSITMSIVQVAEKHSSNTLANRRRVSMLREKAVEELESTRHVAHRLLEEIPPPIPDHATQKLIKLEESPGGLAYWMAVMLSAPSIPVRAALLQPARSDQLIRHDETALPFLPAERPEPVAKSKTGETTFRGSRLDFRAVESLGLVYKSTRGNDQQIVIANRGKPLNSDEIDLISSTSAVLQSTNTPGWDIRYSPLMSLRPQHTLDRLLTEYTTLSAHDIEEIMGETGANPKKVERRGIRVDAKGKGVAIDNGDGTGDKSSDSDAKDKEGDGDDDVSDEERDLDDEDAIDEGDFESDSSTTSRPEVATGRSIPRRVRPRPRGRTPAQPQPFVRGYLPGGPLRLDDAFSTAGPNFASTATGATETVPRSETVPRFWGPGGAQPSLEYPGAPFPGYHPLPPLPGGVPADPTNPFAVPGPGGLPHHYGYPGGAYPGPYPGMYPPYYPYGVPVPPPPESEPARPSTTPPPKPDPRLEELHAEAERLEQARREREAEERHRKQAMERADEYMRAREAAREQARADVAKAKAEAEQAARQALELERKVAEERRRKEEETVKFRIAEAEQKARAERERLEMERRKVRAELEEEMYRARAERAKMRDEVRAEVAKEFGNGVGLANDKAAAEVKALVEILKDAAADSFRDRLARPSPPPGPPPPVLIPTTARRGRLGPPPPPPGWSWRPPLGTVVDISAPPGGRVKPTPRTAPPPGTRYIDQFLVSDDNNSSEPEASSAASIPSSSAAAPTAATTSSSSSRTGPPPPPERRPTAAAAAPSAMPAVPPPPGVGPGPPPGVPGPIRTGPRVLRSRVADRAPPEYVVVESESDSDGSSSDATTTTSSDYSRILGRFDTVKHRGRGVDRACLWKGSKVITQVPPEINPNYIRGNARGQTWFVGSRPVHVVEFEAGYRLQCPCSWCERRADRLGGDSESPTERIDDSVAGSDVGDDRSDTVREVVVREDSDGSVGTVREETAEAVDQSEYLLMSLEWVSLSVLDEYGHKYKVAANSFVYLDPALRWSDIEVITQYVSVQRCITQYRRLRLGEDPGAINGTPPPRSYFALSDDRPESRDNDSDAGLGNGASRPKLLLGPSESAASLLDTAAGPFRALVSGFRSIC